MSENSTQPPRPIREVEHGNPTSASRTPNRSRASTHEKIIAANKKDGAQGPEHPSWRDSLPDMLKQIEDARAHINPPTLHHRLSDAGKDAAAVRAALKSSVIDEEASEEEAEELHAIASRSTAVSPPVSPSGTRRPWSPSSWTFYPITQDVTYPSRTALERSLTHLELLPPLVTPHEIHTLKAHLRRVSHGESFLLQGGDCAELFAYCTPAAIDAKIKLLLQMSLVLIWGLHKPVVRLGRLAGQYAKPRSKPTEVGTDGIERPSFRGDILNGYSVEERTPDPARLVHAYFHSATTLNHIRAQLAAGIADLHRPLDWDLGHVRDAGVKARYERIVHSITESLDFLKTVGAASSPFSPSSGGNGGGKSALETVELFTSHEGLVLEYEQSLTRYLKRPESDGVLSSSSDTSRNHQHPSQSPRDQDQSWYATSAHFLWIGDRTRQIDGAHVEFFRGIENPIGIKVGPSMAADELIRLLDVVDPWLEAGKVTLITRYGADKVEESLGSHLEAVKKSKHGVVWMCDPMHGNTRSTPSGIKTRHFSDILAEVSSALRIHKQHGTYLGGVHLELTGEAVTECVGGSENLVEEDLSLNYTTYCDPRLNEKQALELAFLIANDHRKHHKPHEFFSHV